jgi:hypothetical protein
MVNNNLIWFNGEGDSLNFNWNQEFERYEGKLIFDHSSNDVFRTIPLYLFEKIKPFEYSLGDNLFLQKFQLFNEYNFSFVGSPHINMDITYIETVNNDEVFYSKWIYGNDFESLYPIGSHIRFDQNFIEFTNTSITYVVVGSKKGAIMILSNVDNKTFNTLYGVINTTDILMIKQLVV